MDTRRLILAGICAFSFFRMAAPLDAKQQDLSVDLLMSAADFRLQLMEAKTAADLKQAGLVLVDATRVLRGKTSRVQAGSLRTMMKSLFGDRGAMLQTTLIIVVVREDGLCRYRVRSFDELPESVPLKAGDLVVLIEMS